jgi:hypothetical protein
MGVEEFAEERSTRVGVAHREKMRRKEGQSRKVVKRLGQTRLSGGQMCPAQGWDFRRPAYKLEDEG